MKFVFYTLSLILLILSCRSNQNMVKLITLDPGHFHAALVQKSMYDEIDTNVFVYAPESEDLVEHLNRIKGYNSRSDNPTSWNEEVYTGKDFFTKMLDEKKGNVVVLAGNNQKKTEYIKASLEAGLNVLSDKPMAIDSEDFRLLNESFDIAASKNLVLYDIMTERSEITTILQRELSMNKTLFGQLQKGSPEDPAVTKESVHHFYKYVSGNVLKRPDWFFDVEQQGEGIVDVTTHLVDLIQWECFPEQIIDYTKDINIIGAKRWATAIWPSQFSEITKQNAYPEFLKKDLKDTVLHVFSNGQIDYSIKGIHARVSVVWNYKAPEGAGDTHFSVMRGTRANLVIRQGKEQNYKPRLYIEPIEDVESDYQRAVDSAMALIQDKYPGVHAELKDGGWEIIIPEPLRIGHEEHFAQVMDRFLEYLQQGNLPSWEVPNMKAKYFTTTKAFEMARATNK